MKKIYYLIYSLVLGVFAVWLFTFNAGGPPAGYTGSPGDNGRTCANCHSGGSFNASVSLSHNIPSTGYVPGNTYELTLSVNSSSNKHGFQMTCEDNSNQRQGSFASTDSNTQTLNNNQYIEHTSAGTSQTSWTFDWTAPSQGTGAVTFYVAVNATNANGTTSGDQVVTASFGIQESNVSVAKNGIDGITLYPNPVIDDVLYIKNAGNHAVESVQVVDITGKVIKNLDAPVTAIDFSEVPSGHYVIRIKSSGVQGTYQIIKR